MRIILLPISLMTLKLFSCAENSQKETPKTGIKSVIHLTNLFSLWGPFTSFGSLAQYSHEEASTDFVVVDFAVKRFFNEFSHIPELVTEDVDDNEEELEYLLKYTKIADNAENLYQAFRGEFLYGNKINRLLPHLMKFIVRCNNDWSRDVELIDALIKRKMFGFFFQGARLVFYDYIEKIFADNETIKSLHEYVLSNLSFIEHVFDYFESLIYSNSKKICYIRKWIQVAIYYNMPDFFIERYPTFLLETLKSPGFWTTLIMPKSKYPELFERIGAIIIHHEFTEEERGFYSLLNAVRFGPCFHENHIHPAQFSIDRINLLCHCASLSNKHEIFEKLFRGNQRALLKYNLLVGYEENVPFEMHKYIFDAFRLMPLELHQYFFRQTNFMVVLSKYYLVSSIHWDHLTLSIEFQAPMELTSLDFPSEVCFQYQFDFKHELMNQIYKIPLEMKFLDDLVFGKFILRYLSHFQADDCPINGENLKFISKSPYIRTMLRDNFINFTMNMPSFVVEFEELLKLVDEPTIPLDDFAQISIIDTKCLADLKTIEQFQRLETILGHNLACIIRSDFEYFKYRCLFKYLKESGAGELENISENTRYLMSIY